LNQTPPDPESQPYKGCEKPRVPTTDSSGNPPLSKSEVTHLAFEGGGGKGLAYLGAIRALEELEILSQVQGFAGASAGAITAMLLTIGYKTSEVRRWMSHTDFTSFFDAVEPREALRVEKNFAVIPYTLPEGELWEVPVELMLDEVFVKLQIAAAALGQFSSVAKWRRLRAGQGDPPASKVIPKLETYLTRFWRDQGLFSGIQATRVFDVLLRARLNYSAPSVDPHQQVTFKALQEATGKELVVTGSNLMTGKTVYFGPKGTPQFPVCVAVRISMGLPFIYKPVRVIDEDPNIAGLYVDGGVWNNTPAQVFDEGHTSAQAAPAGAQAASSPSGAPRPTTFVLRLGIDVNEQPTQVPENFYEFFKRYAQLTLMGAGETQFLSSRAFQARELGIQGLSLIDFNPPPVGRDRAIRCAYQSTMEYFKVTPKKISRADDGYANEPWSVPNNAKRPPQAPPEQP
jgi:predicted acylesterase/phospholipase RssA